jgi:hypothetical protein
VVIAVTVHLAVAVGSASLPSCGPDRVFSDEFNGTQVDFAKWSSGYPWGCTNEATGERQCYSPEALAVRDGLLVIQADRRAQGRLPYRSGMITSHHSFAQRFGYYELRAKGLWPAFWLLRRTGAWPPELDVMEQIGSQPNTVLMGQHYCDAAGMPSKALPHLDRAGLHGRVPHLRAVVEPGGGRLVRRRRRLVPLPARHPHRGDACAREPRRGRRRGG